MANFLINSPSSETVGTNSNDLFVLSTLNGNTVFGLEGSDIITAAGASAAGDVRLNAGAGNDTIVLTGAGDFAGSILAAAGNDSLSLGRAFSASIIRGGSGNDTIGVANDGLIDKSTINGNDGSDYLSANVLTNSKSSFFAGGKGGDTLNFDFISGADAFTINGGAGHDSIVIEAASGSLSAFQIAGGDGFDTISFDTIASTNLSASFNVNGDDLNDLITFNGSVTTTVGSATVAGGAGADTIRFLGDASLNQGFIDAGAGLDSIFISGSFSNGTLNGGEGVDTITLGTFGAQADNGEIFGDAGADSFNLGTVTTTRTLSGDQRFTGGSILGYSSFDQSNLSAFDFASASITLADGVSGAGTLTTDYFVIGQDVVSATVADNVGNPTVFTGTDGIATFTSTFSTNLTARVQELDNFLTQGQAIVFNADGGTTNFVFVQGGATSSGTSDDLLIKTNVLANTLEVSAAGTQLILGVTTAVS